MTRPPACGKCLACRMGFHSAFCEGPLSVDSIRKTQKKRAAKRKKRERETVLRAPR